MTLFSPKLFPEGDRSGYLILTKQSGNLHAVWDGFLSEKATLKETHQDALKLLSDAEIARVADRGAKLFDEKLWLLESQHLANNFAYGPLLPYLRYLEKEGGEIRPITLKEDYLLKGEALCRLRVVMAGYRLAAVLKEVVKEDSR
jgi:hypothetical protein